jgi:two-component system response regulator PilR (NtrC family)
VKLLRLLHEKEFRRIGVTKDFRVDVRIIAATNRDLDRAVAEGTFREDLYYRLDVIPIHLPPLRERLDDIHFLVHHFLAKYSQTAGKNVPGITPEAVELLKVQEWRGNVRELENVIERVVALLGPSRRKDDMISPEDLRGCIQKPAQKDVWALPLPEEGLNLEALLDRLERDFLLKALERTRWVKKEAAKLLQMDFRAFRYRLSKHKVTPQNKN